ncbi:hypothetical protein KCU92_g72, partial [Aureobasidium melanogenum]
MPVRSALRTNLARLLSFTACCNLLAPFSAILSPAADRAKLLFVPRASSRRAHFHLPAPIVWRLESSATPAARLICLIQSCLFLPVWAGISVECLLLSWFHAPCTVRRLSCLSQHIPVYKKPPLQHLIVEMTAKTEAITWRQGSAPLSFSILIQYSAPLYTDSTAALTFNASRPIALADAQQTTCTILRRDHQVLAEDSPLLSACLGHNFPSSMRCLQYWMHPRICHQIAGVTAQPGGAICDIQYRGYENSMTGSNCFESIDRV